MKVMEVGVDFDGGGIDRYLYNNCTRINSIDFDFIIIKREYDGILEKGLLEKGYKIFKVPRITKNPFKYFKEVKAILKKGNYDIVHAHLGYKAFPVLICAKRCGIKVRIVHSHLAEIPQGFLGKIIRKISTSLAVRYSTDLAACGVDAAKWMWGEKRFENSQVKVLNNAIDTNEYSFSMEDRQKYRKELNLESKFVVGNVGRLSDQKNQIRLLSIFKKLCEFKPESVLLLIGDGEREEEIRNEITNLKLTEKVLMLGARNDIPQLLSSLDIFVFPSIYEGLPFSLIEAQCNGLQIISSDAVSKYVEVTELVSFISLDETDDKWAEKIMSVNTQRLDNAKEIVKNAGYDLDKEAVALKKFYEDCYQRRQND